MEKGSRLQEADDNFEELLFVDRWFGLVRAQCTCFQFERYLVMESCKDIRRKGPEGCEVCRKAVMGMLAIRRHFVTG
jgi:hypothetical protein